MFIEPSATAGDQPADAYLDRPGRSGTCLRPEFHAFRDAHNLDAPQRIATGRHRRFFHADFPTLKGEDFGYSDYTNR